MDISHFFCTSFKKISYLFPHGNGHILGLSLPFLEHCCAADSKDYEQYEKEPVPVGHFFKRAKLYLRFKRMINRSNQMADQNGMVDALT